MNNNIAFYFGGVFIYWHSIIILIAVAASILAAVALRRKQGEHPGGLMLTAVVSVVPALLLSRLTYWFFNQEQFSDFGDVLFGAGGGYSLLGAASGVILTVFIARLAGWIDNIPRLLDCLAPACALGICIGRLAGYFSFDDRGRIIEAPAQQGFPVSVYNPETGVWELAVFLFESVAAGIIFIAVTVLFFRLYSPHSPESARRGGNVALIFISIYGATQGVLESMRLDSLFMLTLGFVRVLQIASLIMILASLIIFSARSIKKNGFRLIHAVLWAVCAALLGIAFYMELRMHSAAFVRNYSIMGICLLSVFAITFFLFTTTQKSLSPRKPRGSN